MKTLLHSITSQGTFNHWGSRHRHEMVLEQSWMILGTGELFSNSYTRTYLHWKKNNLRQPVSSLVSVIQFL